MNLRAAAKFATRAVGRGSGGALGGTRTHGLSLRRAALYPLSYKRALVWRPALKRRPPKVLAGWCRRRESNPHTRKDTTS